MADQPFLSREASEALVESGMPPEVAKYLRQTRGLSMLGYVLANVLLVGLMFLLIIFIVGGLFASPLTSWLIRWGVYPPDVLLIDLQFYSGVGFILAGIFLAIVPYSLVMLMNRGLAIRSAATGIQQSIGAVKRKWLARWFLKRIFRRIDPQLPPEEYFIAYHWAGIRFSLRSALYIAVPTLLLLSWEMLSASYATPRGIFTGGMFAINRRLVPWDEIEHVSTGAYFTSKTQLLTYVLHYPGGSRDLAQWKMPDGATSNLAALARIDSELRQRNVPWDVARFSARGEEQWQPQAFHHFYDDLPADEQTVFSRVYRWEP